MIKVSLVTVCFNSYKTITDTIEAVKSQDHEIIEYIIVDGGSTDGTRDIIVKSNIHSKFVCEPDDGVYDAMNKGIALSTGDVVGFLNSDDFYVSGNVLSRVAKVFEDPAIDACYGDLCYVDQIDTDKVIRYWKSSDFTPGSFARGWIPPHPTFFARREVYEKYGVFNLKYRIASDVELMMRLLEVHKIRTCYIPDVLIKMRIGGISNKNWSSVLFKQNKEVLRAFKQNGVPVNVVRFLLHKFLSRSKQFLVRPLAKGG